MLFIDDMDDDDKNVDGTRGRSYSLDEFGENNDLHTKLVRTGRQRKKVRVIFEYLTF